MTTAQIRSHLKAEVGNAGSHSALARTLGVSVGYVIEVCKGTRTPGPKLLRALGLAKAAPRYTKAAR